MTGVRPEALLPCAVTHLLVCLEDSPESRYLFSLGAEKRLELQHFFQEAFGVPFCLPAAAQPRVRHRAPLATEVDRHLREHS